MGELWLSILRRAQISDDCSPVESAIRGWRNRLKIR
jgi:hypothetical protein